MCQYCLYVCACVCADRPALQTLELPGPCQVKQEEVRVPRALAKDTWAATHEETNPVWAKTQQPSGALVNPPAYAYVHDLLMLTTYFVFTFTLMHLKCEGMTCDSLWWHERQVFSFLHACIYICSDISNGQTLVWCSLLCNACTNCSMLIGTVTAPRIQWCSGS